jgi:hypothetical protein
LIRLHRVQNRLSTIELQVMFVGVMHMMIPEFRKNVNLYLYIKDQNLRAKGIPVVY